MGPIRVKTMDSLLFSADFTAQGYRSKSKIYTVGPVGIEPTTHGLKVRCSTD